MARPDRARRLRRAAYSAPCARSGVPHSHAAERAGEDSLKNIRAVDLSNADEVLDYLEELEGRFSRLEKRIRAVERELIDELDLEVPDIDE